MNFLKPTKKKILNSLAPFIPVILMPIFLIEIPFSFPLASMFMILQVFIMIIAYSSIIIMAYPLKLVLIPLGMWKYNSSLFIMVSGPEISISGMFLTAFFYSIVIYLLISIRNCNNEKLKK